MKLDFISTDLRKCGWKAPHYMRGAAVLLFILSLLNAVSHAQLSTDLIAPNRPVPVGKAPAMQYKQVKSAPDEAVYAIIFSKGDEVMSGLTDFAIAHKITDAHFTAIGAVSSGLLAWFDLEKKMYHPIRVDQQVEVLSLIGDVAAFNGKPIVHMHAVVGTQQGTTMGGHVFALTVNPTIEVFLTADTTPLAKKDDPSGLRLIDPTH